eukprot:gnl/MRDRNA2_/MRDRNA2_163463_c0_seq1.p1 gnl/MRDRNA2_/MRDRNA2_163463_c0~~gnl/MRDRNA2_/MRDRNA2_163463_c0_seq1.p1  ORF type:complete len:173 (+),score=39.18 gnl/MRDRNA2_/MRDRNA2_163463_c0_seq1:28-519(+)
MPLDHDIADFIGSTRTKVLVPFDHHEIDKALLSPSGSYPYHEYHGEALRQFLFDASPSLATSFSAKAQGFAGEMPPESEEMGELEVGEYPQDLEVPKVEEPPHHPITWQFGWEFYAVMAGLGVGCCGICGYAVMKREKRLAKKRAEEREKEDKESASTHSSEG